MFSEQNYIRKFEKQKTLRFFGVPVSSKSSSNNIFPHDINVPFWFCDTHVPSLKISFWLHLSN